MPRWLLTMAAVALTLPTMAHAQTTTEPGKAASPGSGSKVEAVPGSAPKGALEAPTTVETGKAAQPGSGSKVEAVSGSSGSTETPPTSAGSMDTGTKDLTSGAGPSGKEASPQKALEATPGPDKQGPTAGPVTPPK
jgi:hypothetical protein